MAISDQLAERMAEVATEAFRDWLHEDSDALSQMLHAPILEALEAAFSMGVYKGMAYAGSRLRPPLPDAPEWLERRVTEAIAKSRVSKTTTVVAKRPKPKESK